MKTMPIEFTQMTFASNVKGWIDEIIRKLKLRFDGVDIEIKEPKTRKRADLIIWDNRAAKKIALHIEIWDPQTDPWGEVLDDAYVKATRYRTPYFAVWNITHLYCFDTYKEGDFLDKLWFPHAEAPEKVTNARNYEEAIMKYADEIKEFLEFFLKEFEQVYYGIKPKPLLGIDERFIYRLRGTIHSLSIPVFNYMKKKAKEDSEFRKRLADYFKEQMWTFKGSDDYYDKVARQYAYLLVVKLLFYDILASTPPYSKHLRKITIPAVKLTGAELKKIIDNYLEEAHKVTGTYEIILFSDFLDSITPPDEIVDQIRSLADNLAKYDFSKINYEVLGYIFQRLIPKEERHKLGQYFTRPDVVDLILGFCVKNPGDKVLDGGCGAGTFLVRAYARKKYLDRRKTHKELIHELYGVDIAKFPALLSIVNLVSRDLSQIENTPNIIQRDFFDTLPGKEYPAIEIRGNKTRIWHVKLPEKFDAVVMNPPYTRQEEMEDIFEEEKKKAYERSIKDWIEMHRDTYSRNKKPKLSRRSSIYVYFFIHGGYFLREGGRMGFITSNSWLDVDYGGDLQRYFLENFKIKTIIESKAERWFEDADINTVITILERRSDPKERDNNIVKFVLLKRPLADFIPPAEDEDERWRRVEELVKFIESTNTYYEDDRIRIYPKKQKELWDEGYDDEEQDYVGSKWGKYLRAPQVFFKVLEKGVGKLVLIKHIAKIGRGLRTGDNEYFYLDANEVNKWHLHKFVKPLVKSPKDSNCILLSKANLKYWVFMVDNDLEQLINTSAYKYIQFGIQRGVPDKRKKLRWWSLQGECINAEILIPVQIWDTYKIFVNDLQDQVFYDQQLSGIMTGSKTLAKTIATFLVSTLGNLLLEVYGRRQLGEGSLQIPTEDLKNIVVLNPNSLSLEQVSKLHEIFDALSMRPLSSIFEELSANSRDEVSLDKVKPDRRKLDEIIMGEILGLTDEEQLEVYRAIVDLVKSRIERAKSVEAKKKQRGEKELDALVNLIVDEMSKLLNEHIKGFKSFPEAYLSPDIPVRIINIPRVPRAVACSNLLEGAYVDYGSGKLKCTSIDEAKYIALAILAGKAKIPVPEDESILSSILKKHESLVKDLNSKINGHLEQAVPDKKHREKVKPLVLRKLFGVDALEYICQQQASTRKTRGR